MHLLYCSLFSSAFMTLNATHQQNKRKANLFTGNGKGVGFLLVQVYTGLKISLTRSNIVKVVVVILLLTDCLLLIPCL